MEYKISEYTSVLPGYQQDSTLKPRPFYHTGFEKSLERIVLNEPVKENGMVERVFTNKGRTLKSTIKALFNEIMLRERLDSFLLYRINDGICRQHNYLESLKVLNQHNYSPELLNEFAGKKAQIEDSVLKLEQEKRKEYLECWKDLMSLKKYLLSALKDYWNLTSRESFLNVENDKHRGYMQETEAYDWRKG